MNKLKLLFVILVISTTLEAQKSYTLKEFIDSAHANMPALNNSSLITQIDSLESQILTTNYYPKLYLKAQGTWQSEVVGLDINMPGISIPKASQSQYKLTTEISQLIWDGGRTKAIKNQVGASTKLKQLKTEQQFHNIKVHVTSLYFAFILAQQQLNITNQLNKTLLTRIKDISNKVDNGIVSETNLFLLQAEQLKTEQDISSQKYQIQGIADVLKIYTSLPISISDTLQLPQPNTNISCNRIQLDIFNSQNEIYKSSISVLQKNRMPMIQAFGQLGYGNPGLNMMKNEADQWFYGGVKVSWNIFDWNSTKKKKQQILINQQTIENSRNQFLQQINSQKQNYLSEIKKYDNLLKTDSLIIKTRKKITKSYEDQLSQGTITSSIYVQELFKETASELTQQIHKIQLVRNKTMMQILLEK